MAMRLRRFCTNSCARHELERWIDQCVIGLNLCPFASDVRSRTGAMRTVVVECASEQEVLQAARAEIAGIAIGGNFASTAPETTLLGIKDTSECGFLVSFAGFLRISVAVEALCAEASTSAECSTDCALQLAIFHPLARATLMEHSKPLAAMMAEMESTQSTPVPADLAIRAPMPVLHFLRTPDVTAAVEAFAPTAGAESIPQRNKRRIEALVRRGRLADFEQCLGQSSLQGIMNMNGTKLMNVEKESQ